VNLRIRVALVVSLLAVGAGAAVALLANVGPAWLLVWAGAVIALVPAVPLFFGRPFDIFEPVYLFAVSYLVLFVVRPVFDLSQALGLPLIAGQDPTPGYELALALGLAGACSFFVGYYAPLGRRLARHLGDLSGELDSDRLTVFSGATVMLGLGLFAAFIVTSGGLDTLALILSGRSASYFSVFAQSTGYLFLGLQGLVGVGILLLATAKSWRSLRGGIALGILLISQSTAIAGGNRIWLLPVASAVGVLWYLRRGRRPRLIMVVLVSAPLFLFGITLPRDYRNVELRQGTLVDSAIGILSNPGQSVSDFFSTPDTAMLSTLAVETQYVPAVMPFQLGGTYLAELLRPIPRALWADRPREGEVYLMQVIFPSLFAANVQFTFSLFGEPYMNWGLFGVLGFCLAFGAAWRALLEWFRRSQANRLTQGVFAASWPFMFVYVRGGLGVDYQRQVIVLLPILVGAWYARRLTRTTAELSL